MHWPIRNASGELATGAVFTSQGVPFIQGGDEFLRTKQGNTNSYNEGDATQQSLREIWSGPAYRDFRKALKSNVPPEACANCGLRWSL